MPKFSTSEDDEFLTSDDVVELLLSDPVLRSKSATCVLPAIRVGAEWRFRRRDLDAWVAQQLNLAASDDDLSAA